MDLKSIRKYNTDERMKYLIDTDIIIPLNQRNFAWEHSHISELLMDIYLHYQEDKQYPIGTFVLQVVDEKENIKCIWDGQQRFITYILTLIKLVNTYKGDGYFFDDRFKDIVIPRDDVTEKQKQFLTDNNFKHFCKYKYKSEDNIDNVMLHELIHDNMKFMFDFFVKTSENTYKCKHCHQTFKRKNDGTKHLKVCKEISQENRDKFDKSVSVKDNKILNAFNIITEIIQDWNLDYTKAKQFTKFLLNSVRCDIEESTDYKYVAMRFEHLNNRGVPVEPIVIYKNMYMIDVEEHNLQDIQTYFTELQKLVDEYKDICNIDSKKLFELCLRIHYKSFTIEVGKIDKLVCMHKQNSNGSDKSDDIMILFSSLNTILKKFKIVLEYMKPHDMSYSFDYIDIGGWVYLLLPLGVHFGKNLQVLDKILDILATHNVRIKCLQKRHVKYDHFEFQNAFYKVCFEAYHNTTSNEHKILSSVRDVIKKSISQYEVGTLDEYKHKVENIPNGYNPQKIIKFILHYYLQHKKTKAVKIQNNELDLEHIIPQSKFAKNDNSKHRIGNCTLLEKSNTNGHKGNRSIQDASWQIKKDSFKKSNVSITQDVYNMFKDVDNFDMECVKKREADICQELFDMTEKILNPKV